MNLHAEPLEITTVVDWTNIGLVLLGVAVTVWLVVLVWQWHTGSDARPTMAEGMMRAQINVVSIFGLVGLVIGLGGDSNIIIGGCILIGSSLIAKAIHYRGRE